MDCQHSDHLRPGFQPGLQVAQQVHVRRGHEATVAIAMQTNLLLDVLLR